MTTVENSSIHRIYEEAIREIEAASDLDALRDLSIRYLGRKGRVTGFLRGISKLPPEERAGAGKRANDVKQQIDDALRTAVRRMEETAASIEGGIDVTLPGRPFSVGSLHPLNRIMGEICGIFRRMGFSVAEGPEVETDYYNFEALNVPKYHPARDMQDTFYVSDAIVLRTQTSPMQIRVMETQAPPLAVIAPGKVYRCDSDLTHTPMFHQVEGLLVDEAVSFAELKGTLTRFVHEMFDRRTSIRFRPSFFPFTEPSAEVDILCVICRGMDAGYAPAPDGLKFWDPVWFIPMCSGASTTTLNDTPGLLLAWGLNGLPC